MTKQQKSRQDDQQQQDTLKRGKNPSQQGGQNPQGQASKIPASQGQPGARQSDQGSGPRTPPARSSNGDAQPGSQRSQTASQHGSGIDDDDQSPEMNQAGERSDRRSRDESGENLRRGALDAQYGTDTQTKTGQQTNRPQGSSESTAGSDRDTMGGARRSKGR